MSTLSQLLSCTYSFKHADKVYKVGPFDQNCKLVVEKALFQKMKNNVRQLRSEMTDDDYARVLMGINERWAMGEYDITSANGLRYMQSPQGQIALAAAIFHTTEHDMEQLIRSDAKQDIDALIVAVLADSQIFDVKNDANVRDIAAKAKKKFLVAQ